MRKKIIFRYGCIEISNEGSTCEAVAYDNVGKDLYRTSSFYEDIAVNKLMKILHWGYSSEPNTVKKVHKGGKDKYGDTKSVMSSLKNKTGSRNWKVTK